MFVVLQKTLRLYSQDMSALYKWLVWFSDVFNDL